MNISHLQRHLPWTIPYSPEFVAARTELKHLDMQHAMIHGIKSMGKLSALFDHQDHGNGVERDRVDVPNLVADLVVCALRMANTSPWGKFDLEAAVVERLRRNGVELPPVEL